MFIRTGHCSEYCCSQEDEIQQKKITTERAKSGNSSKTMEIVLGESQPGSTSFGASVAIELNSVKKENDGIGPAEMDDASESLFPFKNYNEIDDKLYANISDDFSQNLALIAIAFNRGILAEIISCLAEKHLLEESVAFALKERCSEVTDGPAFSVFLQDLKAVFQSQISTKPSVSTRSSSHAAEINSLKSKIAKLENKNKTLQQKNKEELEGLKALPVPKNDICVPQDRKQGAFLTECFADFVKYTEGKGLNQPKVTLASPVLLSTNPIKHAWMQVLTMPWISQRKKTVRKLETVIWVNSILQSSKHWVALCGYPLAIMSSSLLQLSELNWFLRIFYNSSLIVGYSIPYHLLLDKILAWYCERYVTSAILDDFFRLDMIDETTYFLYQQTQLPNIKPCAVQDGDLPEDEKLQLDDFESNEDKEQGYPLCPEYERIRILTDLLAKTRRKLNFHTVVRNTKNLQHPIISMRNRHQKALPTVNKSYICTQLKKTALKMDLYTWGVLVAPFILLPTHEMCIFAYSYFVLLEHYYHRNHLNVADVLTECKEIIQMEFENLKNVLGRYYGFVDV